MRVTSHRKNIVIKYASSLYDVYQNNFFLNFKATVYCLQLFKTYLRIPNTKLSKTILKAVLGSFQVSQKMVFEGFENRGGTASVHKFSSTERKSCSKIL
jgi:hypothetical protein